MSVVFIFFAYMHPYLTITSWLIALLMIAAAVVVFILAVVVINLTYDNEAFGLTCFGCWLASFTLLPYVFGTSVVIAPIFWGSIIAYGVGKLLRA